MHAKHWWKLLKESVIKASDDRLPKLSASLAYYTIFSLPAMLLVVTALANLFLTQRDIQEILFGELRVFIGFDVADQLQDTLKKTEVWGDTWFATVAGIATLLFAATGAFAEMQDSLNLIWGVRAKKQHSTRALIMNRVLSFGMIATLGFLLLVSLVLSALLSVLTDRLTLILPNVTVYLAHFLDYLLSFLIIVLMFAGIFKVLPDLRIRWMDVFTGAVFTAVLFLIGKTLISVYLSKSSLATAYGAAGSVIILLVWVYYSSILLYFGAEFTRAYAFRYGRNIRPNNYSEWIDPSVGANPESESVTKPS